MIDFPPDKRYWCCFCEYEVPHYEIDQDKYTIQRVGPSLYDGSGPIKRYVHFYHKACDKPLVHMDGPEEIE